MWWYSLEDILLVSSFFVGTVFLESYLMSLKSRFKVNAKLSNEGIRYEYTNDPNSDGTIPCLILARMSGQNKEYIKGFIKAGEEIQEKYGVKSENELPTDVAKQIRVNLFVDTVLRGWENIEPNDDGVKIPFSKEEAKKLFMDEDWFELYEDAQQFSITRDNYKVDKIVKN